MRTGTLWIIAVLAGLAACAPTVAINSRGETLDTGTRWFDARIAATADLNQIQVDACKKEGLDVGWKWADLASPGFDRTRAGYASEACVARLK